MRDILKELAAKISPSRTRMFELHSWIVDYVTAALSDEKNPISQKDLAERMEVDPASLSRWLSFKGANLTLETVGKLEHGIGRTIFRTKADVKHEIANNLFEAQELLSKAQQRSTVRHLQQMTQAVGSTSTYSPNSTKIKHVNEQERTTAGTHMIVQYATGRIKPTKEETTIPREEFVKSGSEGGKKRAASLTKKRRSEIAKEAAKTRWKKKP